MTSSLGFPAGDVGGEDSPLSIGINQTLAITAIAKGGALMRASAGPQPSDAIAQHKNGPAA
ncbi:MAG: hypothetical protein AAF608_01225 [Pseudomonadota bacterium]